MGAKGGAELIRAWRCSTCNHVYDERPLWKARESAVECCNITKEVLAAQEAARTRKVAARARTFAKVPSPRVTIKRETWKPSWGSRETHIYAVAKAKCPRGPACGYVATVRIEIRPSIKRAEAATRARSLAKAEIARHLHQH